MRAGLVIVKYAQEYAALSTSPARTPSMDWLRQRYPTYRPGRTWNAAAEPTHAQAASPEKAANPVLDELAVLYKYFEYAKNTYGENLKKMREVSSLYDFMHRNKLDVPQAWKAWLRPPEPVNLPR